MTYLKNADQISFTRLSFASAKTGKSEEITQKGTLGYSRIYTFRDFMERRYPASETGLGNLSSQILVAQVTQESDE